MNNAKLGTVAWVAIYLGMILIGLGVSLQHGGAAFGWGVTLAGASALGVGALLIWRRSRVGNDP